MQFKLICSSLLAQAEAGSVKASQGITLVGKDWAIIAVFFAAIMLIGFLAARQAGKSSANFFLGGRTMPWWLLGVSMVACTFSCDTPNLVTSLVRGDGVVANWGWWAFLITGMVTVFIYAQLWRRTKVMTDLEFYEMRYSGKSAAVLRGFRSLYLGVFFNCLIMGSVTLAAIKIGQVIFGVDPWVAVVLGSAGVVIYATAGGIKSCIWADFFQYSIAMFGAVYAAVVACRQPEVMSLSKLLENPAIIEKLNWMPDFSTWLAWVPLLLIPVTVQWWAVWYPGAEPGGGGYIAQRMLAAKDEKNAIGATMFFNFMHYAMRPWPWIIVALASMVCYPTLAQIKAEFPGIDPTYLKPDIAYPVMISKLGPGFLGLVVASLIAAYMSTIGTHLNWGSSYAVNDFYKRFVKPNASEKEMVQMGRLCTVLLMVIAGFFALTFLQDAGQAFQILLLSGAGTGAIYILRWFWWRINAWTEIVAMIVATIVAFWIVLGVGDQGTMKWYVGSSAVSDRVYVVSDAETVGAVKTTTQKAQVRIDALSGELEILIDKWKKASKESVAARDIARAAYDNKFDELESYKKANSISSLVFAMGEKSWYADLQQFQLDQRQWQLERINKRREGLKLELKSLADISVDLGGIIANGKIYLYHPDIANLKFPVQLLVCVILVTAAWVITTLVTPASDKKTLRSFYKLCHPGGPGWRKVVEQARAEGDEIDQKNAIGDWKLPIQILCVFLGCITIYSSLFSVGNFVYGNQGWGFVLIGVAAVSVFALFKCFGKIGVESSSD
ncbi:MAG: Na+:solute symporter [Sedimentisphaerales bacterium]|nr:Na+:solute symporter [Sedimentisphaerales bacterium]